MSLNLVPLPLLKLPIDMTFADLRKHEALTRTAIREALAQGHEPREIVIGLAVAARRAGNCPAWRRWYYSRIAILIEEEACVHA